MARRIFWIGALLLLSSCFPHMNLFPEKTITSDPSVQEYQISLFTPSEFEALFPKQVGPPPQVDSSSPPDSSGDSSPGLALQAGGESNEEVEILPPPKSDPKKEVEFDIPIVINARVEQFIFYFQTLARKNFTNWLGRSERYIPFMKQVLRENGLPEDLVYLALIESGFNPHAYSRAKASGPWQFIYLTGKRYGLKSDWWVDERRDPEKSTVAAAKYLKDLYDMFECWYLAAAGYNAGEQKIVRAMKRYRTEDFWELSRYQYLKQETKNYVPQMIAAAVIAKDPEKYGFSEIEYQAPLQYEKVGVPPVTDLRIVAKACEISLDELKDMNPELLRWCTPPDRAEYEIKIPVGTKELFEKNFVSLQPVRKFEFKTHLVRNGETLSRIAHSYRVDVEPLLAINAVKKTSRLKVGTNLLIPVPKDREAGLIATASPHPGNGPSHSQEIIYTIKKGDSLWSIANEMRVNIGALSRWNNLHPEKKLTPGNKLKIRLAEGRVPPAGEGNKGKEIMYIVKEGDTLWTIAKKHNLTVSQIKTWNSLPQADRIKPADQLRLKMGEVKSSTLN